MCHQPVCPDGDEQSGPFPSLKVLKAQGLIKSRRVGKEMYYTAADGEASRLLHHMIEMLVDISCPREKSEPFTKKETAHCQIILVWAVF